MGRETALVCIRLAVKTRLWSLKVVINIVFNKSRARQHRNYQNHYLATMEVQLKLQ